MTTTDTAAIYATKSDAQAIVNGLDAVTYHLAHGEYERPTYTARKIRGQSSYYIHAKRFYFPSTFYARPSGPLSSNEICASSLQSH